MMSDGGKPRSRRAWARKVWRAKLAARLAPSPRSELWDVSVKFSPPHLSPLPPPPPMMGICCSDQPVGGTHQNCQSQGPGRGGKGSLEFVQNFLSTSCTIFGPSVSCICDFGICKFFSENRVGIASIFRPPLRSVGNPALSASLLVGLFGQGCSGFAQHSRCTRRKCTRCMRTCS